VWQKLRAQYHEKGLEVVTVGMDTLGVEGCRAFIEAAEPDHPSLIDQHHVLADLFGVINIPSSIWIDEQGVIVRPPEAAPVPPSDRTGPNVELPDEMPQRMLDMMGEVVKMPNDAQAYHEALQDWVENGSASRYALSPEEVVARSRPRDEKTSEGHAHFELAAALEASGRHDAAIAHYKAAHELVSDSWTFRRQAWSLESFEANPIARFWQGPDPDSPEAWPYESDWLADVKAAGAENYNDRFRP
jgi:hypothetical protein